MPKICIDPGHGGTDPGATHGKVYEKTITLAIAQKLNALLKAQGFATVMTRDKDLGIDKYKRCTVSNNAKADLFVSIHVNSNEGTPATGIETLIYAEGGNAEKCAKKVHAQVIGATKAKDRGIKERPGLVVLNTTKAPAILIETGFINNTSDRDKLLTKSYQNAIAEAITKGICSYFGKEYKVDKFTDIKGHYAEEYIKEASDLGLVSGMGDGTFRPDEPLTRGQACIIIVKAIRYLVSLLK